LIGFVARLALNHPPARRGGFGLMHLRGVVASGGFDYKHGAPLELGNFAGG